MMALLLLVMGVHSHADSCSSDTPGGCSADVSGLLQTKVKVSDLESEEKQKLHLHHANPLSDPEVEEKMKRHIQAALQTKVKDQESEDKWKLHAHHANSLSDPEVEEKMKLHVQAALQTKVKDQESEDKWKLHAHTAQKKMAEQDSVNRVAASISRLGALPINVAKIMDIDEKGWIIEEQNSENDRLYQYYQDFEKDVKKEEAYWRESLAKAAIAKAAVAILKEEFDTERAINPSVTWHLPSPLLNPWGQHPQDTNMVNDTEDYAMYLNMNESEVSGMIKNLSEYVNPMPKPLKPIDNPWANMSREYEWIIYSAVPVASHLGNQGPLLALLGSDAKQGYDPEDARDAPYQAVMRSKHSALFPSGDIVPFKKHRKQVGEGGDIITWFADLPPADVAVWLHPPGEPHEACLTFSILDGAENFVKNFTSCHNPSVLPPAGSQYDFTLCYAMPPMHDHKKKEVSGFLSLPQSILYHLRHGVDQVVVYLGPRHREHAMALLRPFTAQGKCTIVFLDSQSSPQNAINDETGDDYRRYNLGGVSLLVENYLLNDCLNRFRGRTRLLAGMGFDEFIYAPAWNSLPGWATSHRSLFDAAGPLLSVGCATDYNVLSSYIWVKPADPFENLLLHSTKHYEHASIGFTMKSLYQPDCVSIIWIHHPSDCFGTRCRRLQEPLLEFAHHNVLPKSVLANQTLVSDNFFVDEARLLRAELCVWMKQAGFGCEPEQWLPLS